MFEELFHSLMDQWAHAAQGLFSEVGAVKIWAFAIPLVPACYGVWVKWRNSGYRMLERLEEFVEVQEKRVDGAQELISKLIEIPSPAKSLDEPALDQRALSKSLRRMNWGFGRASTGHLADATRACEDRARLAKLHFDDNVRRQALTHLLIGAKDASRVFNDAHDRNATRGRALAEFEKALILCPDDADATQYAGLMLLQLARPVEAAAKFSKLVQLRSKGGGRRLSDAHRLLATAYSQYPWHQAAIGSLTNAINVLPADCTLDLALIHEQQGLHRRDAGFQNAIDSFREARRLFVRLAETVEGRAGLKRVDVEIAKLNFAEASVEPPQ